MAEQCDCFVGGGVFLFFFSNVDEQDTVTNEHCCTHWELWWGTGSGTLTFKFHCCHRLSTCITGESLGSFSTFAQNTIRLISRAKYQPGVQPMRPHEWLWQVLKSIGGVKVQAALESAPSVSFHYHVFLGTSVSYDWPLSTSHPGGSINVGSTSSRSSGELRLLHQPHQSLSHNICMCIWISINGIIIAIFSRRVMNTDTLNKYLDAQPLMPTLFLFPFHPNQKLLLKPPQHYKEIQHNQSSLTFHLLFNGRQLKKIDKESYTYI